MRKMIVKTMLKVVNRTSAKNHTGQRTRMLEKVDSVPL